MSKLNFTNEQKAIIKKGLKGESFFVEAEAGVGKTSTLFFYFRYAKQKLPNKKHLLLSFNTHLQKEYIEKIKQYSLDTIDVMTINKLAKSHTLDKGIVLVDTVKISTKSIRSIEPFIHGNDLLKYNTTSKKKSGWNLGVHLREFCTSDDDWDNLSFTLFCNILKDGRCTHDMYMKLFRESVKNGFITLNYDSVIIDEIQDTSMTLFNIFRDLPIKQKIATGDIKQSIYMFLLKDFNMSNTKFYKNSPKLSLSKSFRCADYITEKVTYWLFRGFMNDDTTIYTGVPSPDTSDTSIMHLTPTNNQVLLKAYSLARVGIKYRFQETWTNLTRDLKDIDFVLRYINKYKFKTSKAQIRKVSNDIVKEAKLKDIEVYGRDIQDYLIEDLLAYNNEYAEIPFTKFIEDYSTSNRTKTGLSLVNILKQKNLYLNTFLNAIKDNIDNNSEVLVSNVHKVKGSQSGTVNLFKFKSPEILAEETAERLAEDLEIPVPELLHDCLKLIENNKFHKYSLNYRQNINLFYVAITRAKHTVTFEACDGISNMRWNRISKRNPTGKIEQMY